LAKSIGDHNSFLLTKLDISDNYKISDAVAADLFRKMEQCTVFSVDHLNLNLLPGLNTEAALSLL
jgi:hypothetical protein